MNRLLSIISIICIFFTSFNRVLGAVTYSPQIKEIIIFYPVANSYKLSEHGYDCFYYTDLAYKGGKCKAKDSFRFKLDKNGLTPFSEIEGHIFTVTAIESENENKDVSKKSFLCFLKRDDGEKLFLRIPFVRKDKDNELTKAMSLYFSNNTYAIHMPVCSVFLLDSIKSSFQGRTLVYSPEYHYDVNYTMQVPELYSTYVEQVTPNAKVSEIKRREYFLSCDSIKFVDVESFVYQQPVAFCRSKDSKWLIPVFNFRGKGKCVYGENFSIMNIFKEKSVFLNENIKKYSEYVEKYLHKSLRYKYNQFGDTRFHGGVSPRTVDGESSYKLVNNDVYYCDSIDVCNYYNSSPISFIFIDKDSVRFQISVNELSNFGKKSRNYFIEESIYQEQIAKERQYDLDRKEKEKKEIANRRARLIKKYGKSNAEYILRGEVCIGFSKEMCREAWGSPNKVNRTTNAWGSYEQWVYGNGNYLYFDDDTLTSIQN